MILTVSSAFLPLEKTISHGGETMREAKEKHSKWGACIIALVIGLVTVAPNCYADTIISTAEARAEIARITGDTRDVEQVRADVLSVLNQGLSFANESDSQRMKSLITQVEGMGYEELLGTFSADFITSFSQFKGVFESLHSIQQSSALSVDGLSARTQATSVNLRDASYSSLCGSVRADTTATVIALGVFLIAEAIKEAAVSGCGTVVVVAGFGGSPQSAICSGIVAGVFQIARGVWEEFLLCQESIDNAEILGTYERVQDVFNSLNEHDTAIKNKLDILEGKTDLAIRLLLTPQGKRPGWNNQVDIELNVSGEAFEATDSMRVINPNEEKKEKNKKGKKK
jgi:hypothetical protein